MSGTRRKGKSAVRRIVILAACLAFQCTTIAGAQSPAAGPPSPIVTGDRSALATIVMSSVAEVQLCGLAVEKTHNPEVRSFCRSAVHDHARTAIAGMQLAQTLGVSDVKLQALPQTRAQIDSLTQYSGHDFDRAFLLVQIERHEDDQDALRYASEVATDAALKRYEDSVLPRVEKYLHLAEGALNSVSRDQP